MKGILAHAKPSILRICTTLRGSSGFSRFTGHGVAEPRSEPGNRAPAFRMTLVSTFLCVFLCMFQDMAKIAWIRTRTRAGGSQDLGVQPSSREKEDVLAAHLGVQPSSREKAWIRTGGERERVLARLPGVQPSSKRRIFDRSRGPPKRGEPQDLTFL